MNDNYNEHITFSGDYIISTPDIVYEPSECLGSFMFTNMKKHKDKIAQIEAETGKTETFGELLERCVRTALHMADKNITREHVITICTKNHLNAAVPYIATQFLGAKTASIDASFSAQEMTYLLNMVRPKMIFANSDSVPTLEKVVDEILLDCEIVVFGDTEKHTPFSKLLKHHEQEMGFEPVEIQNLKDTALIYFSSGTTGLPKGICLNHYAIVGQLINAKYTADVDDGYVQHILGRVSFPMTSLCYTSLYWLSAGSIIMSCISIGQCRLVCNDFDPKEIWNLLQKYKPSMLILTPIQIIEMLTYQRNDIDVKCVLALAIIGSSISREYIKKLQDIFTETTISRGYGQTEISGAVTIFLPNNTHHNEIRKKPEKIDSVGLPLRGTLYKVVDIETNQNVGPHQQGELRIKSKFIMNGYFNADSSSTFDEYGWLKTGDIVYYDEDFCFYIVDRIKEAFKYQGWFIAPTAIEEVLQNHPAVKLPVVIGIPKDDGHHPMGVVVLKEGYNATPEEIEKFVEKRVSERQRLRAGVKIVDSVPLTVTGKVMRRKLKQMVLDGEI